MEGYIRPDRKDRRRKRPEQGRDIGQMSVDALNRVVTKREEDRAATPDALRPAEERKEGAEDESSPS